MKAPTSTPEAPVNVHKNAKLTPTGRAQMIERLEAGESAADVAASIGVSKTTVYKWWKRWKAEGEKGLEDRSCRPHRSPNRLPRHRRRQIERLRRKRWSTPRIARETGIPLSTVGLECRRLGLGRLKALDPPQPVVRYERDRPGELLHLDIKKLGRIGRGGIASTATAAVGPGAWAGSTCTSVWTTPAGWRTRRSCPTRRRSG